MDRYSLNRSEQELFESVLCGIVRYSMSDDPKVLQVNSACAQIYGYSSTSEFSNQLSEGLSSLVYFYDKEIMRGFLRRCIRTGQTINFGHRIRRKDGAVGYIMGTLSIISLNNDQKAIQAIFMDSGSRVVQQDVRKTLAYTPFNVGGGAEKAVIVAQPGGSGVLREILEPDYYVIDAENEQQVLSVLGKESDNIAAVLVDETIIANGDYRFMASLKSSILYASIPVVVLAEGEDRNEEELLSYGANEWFHRPYNPNVVRLRLANLIELRDTAVQRNAIETLVNNIPGGVLIFKLEKKPEVLFYSSNLANFGDYTKEENHERLKKGGFEAFIYDKDLSRFNESFSAAERAEAAFEINFRTISKSGALCWYHTHAVKIRMEDGCPVYQTVLSPTTAGEKMYQNVLSDSFSGLAVYDAASGELLFINNAAASLLKAEGKNDILSSAFIDMSLSPECYESKQIITPKTGRHLILNAKLMDWNGIEAQMVFFTDDTDSYREQSRQLSIALSEAKKANAAKSDFLSRMSHDIRTPMNAIIGMAKLAQEEGESKESIQKYISQISSSGEYLLGLINDILDMSRIESEHVELHLEPCTIGECVEFVRMSMKNQINDRSINFIYEQNGDRECPVLLDKMRTRQILFNLISNAIKFTKQGGSVMVAVDQTGRDDEGVDYKITVSDNGVGISADALPRIFQPFEQADPMRESEQHGSGLGLAIVQNLVRLMGGEISVESKVNEGTRFTVLLRAEHADAVTVQTAEPTDDASEYDFSGKHVLVVEDHPINRKIAELMLTKKQCAVDTAVNGKEALDMLLFAEPGTYQAVLLDVRMPVMDGLDAAKAIRSSGREDLKTIPLIAMTANAFAEDKQKSYDAGMDAHLTKPIDMDLLYRTLNNIWS